MVRMYEIDCKLVCNFAFDESATLSLKGDALITNDLCDLFIWSLPFKISSKRNHERKDWRCQRASNSSLVQCKIPSENRTPVIKYVDFFVPFLASFRLRNNQPSNWVANWTWGQCSGYFTPGRNYSWRIMRQSFAGENQLSWSCSSWYGVVWITITKVSAVKVIIIIIQCFFLPFIDREPTTWPANNFPQISVLRQIIFCSCIMETILLCENGTWAPWPLSKWLIKRTVTEW